MIIAANFKTNHTRASLKTFVSKLQNDGSNELRIYPPSTSLQNLELADNIKLGAQNFYPVNKGSFTGEIGLEQLEEFNINSVLIGHSERRHILNESNELIREKFNFAKKQNWEIIYCIGESKDVRDSGKLMNFLQAQLELIDLEYENLIIAYEPVWAIGTGAVATKEDIQEVLDFLRTKTSAPLLYGGSVKPSNVSDIYKLKNCDGVLVGTASWEVESFNELIKLANS